MIDREPVSAKGVREAPLPGADLCFIRGLHGTRYVSAAVSEHGEPGYRKDFEKGDDI